MDAGSLVLFRDSRNSQCRACNLSVASYLAPPVTEVQLGNKKYESYHQLSMGNFYSILLPLCVLVCLARVLVAVDGVLCHATVHSGLCLEKDVVAC